MTSWTPGTMQHCGVRVDLLDQETAIRRILHWANSTIGHGVHLCNAYTLGLARKDPAYRDALNADALNLPDGTPVAWVGRAATRWYRGSAVRGPSLMRCLIDVGRGQGLKHYFVGASIDVLDTLVNRVHDQYPGAIVVGTYAPPFQAEFSAAEIQSMVQAAEIRQAQIVWVGLGTPKQDYFVRQAAKQGQATYIAIGAAFDFLAGTKKEAPHLLRGSGLEWLFRLATEPRRLWRRYTVDSLSFLAAVPRTLRMGRWRGHI